MVGKILLNYHDLEIRNYYEWFYLGLLSASYTQDGIRLACALN